MQLARQPEQSSDDLKSALAEKEADLEKFGGNADAVSEQPEQSSDVLKGVLVAKEKEKDALADGEQSPKSRQELEQEMEERKTEIAAKVKDQLEKRLFKEDGRPDADNEPFSKSRQELEQEMEEKEAALTAKEEELTAKEEELAAKEEELAAKETGQTQRVLEGEDSTAVMVEITAARGKIDQLRNEVLTALRDVIDLKVEKLWRMGYEGGLTGEELGKITEDELKIQCHNYSMSYGESDFETLKGEIDQLSNRVLDVIESRIQAGENESRELGYCQEEMFRSRQQHLDEEINQQRSQMLGAFKDVINVKVGEELLGAAAQEDVTGIGKEIAALASRMIPFLDKQIEVKQAQPREQVSSGLAVADITTPEIVELRKKREHADYSSRKPAECEEITTLGNKIRRLSGSLLARVDAEKKLVTLGEEITELRNQMAAALGKEIADLRNQMVAVLGKEIDELESQRSLAGANSKIQELQKQYATKVWVANFDLRTERVPTEKVWVANFDHNFDPETQEVPADWQADGLDAEERQELLEMLKKHQETENEARPRIDTLEKEISEAEEALKELNRKRPVEKKPDDQVGLDTENEPLPTFLHRKGHRSSSGSWLRTSVEKRTERIKAREETRGHGLIDSVIPETDQADVEYLNVRAREWLERPKAYKDLPRPAVIENYREKRNVREAIALTVLAATRGDMIRPKLRRFNPDTRREARWVIQYDTQLRALRIARDAYQKEKENKEEAIAEKEAENVQKTAAIDARIEPLQNALDDLEEKHAYVVEAKYRRNVKPKLIENLQESDQMFDEVRGSIEKWLWSKDRGRLEAAIASLERQKIRLDEPVLRDKVYVANLQRRIYAINKQINKQISKKAERDKNVVDTGQDDYKERRKQSEEANTKYKEYGAIIDQNIGPTEKIRTTSDEQFQKAHEFIDEFKQLGELAATKQRYYVDKTKFKELSSAVKGAYDPAKPEIIPQHTELLLSIQGQEQARQLTEWRLTPGVGRVQFQVAQRKLYETQRATLERTIQEHKRRISAIETLDGEGEATERRLREDAVDRLQLMHVERIIARAEIDLRLAPKGEKNEYRGKLIKVLGDHLDQDNMRFEPKLDKTRKGMGDTLLYDLEKAHGQNQMGLYERLQAFRVERETYEKPLREAFWNDNVDYKNPPELKSLIYDNWKYLRLGIQINVTEIEKAKINFAQNGTEEHRLALVAKENLARLLQIELFHCKCLLFDDKKEREVYVRSMYNLYRMGGVSALPEIEMQLAYQILGILPTGDLAEVSEENYGERAARLDNQIKRLIEKKNIKDREFEAL